MLALRLADLFLVEVRVWCLQGKYFEAEAGDIDPEKKTVVACFPADAGMDECCFKVEYDILILGLQQYHT